MNFIRVGLVFSTVTGLYFSFVSPISAQDCASGAAITVTEMNTLLNNRYACMGSSPNASWNELHDLGSGKVLDYKKGPKDPVDPSDTPAHPTGSYSITSAAEAGSVTYTYGSSNVSSYNIRANLGSSAPAPGLYSFCSIAGGQNLAVTVSTAPC